MLKTIFLFLAVFLAAFWAFDCQTNKAVGQANANERQGIIDAAGTMNVSRATHRATLLNNGKVLITGGFSADRNSLSSAEIYDPKTKTFSLGEKMSVGRASHSSTLLPDGRVLIAGGSNGDYLDSAEIYDPKTGKFSPTGKMTMPRSEHIAVLLKNGKVLLAGGVGTGWTFLADAEIFDPATNSFSKTGSMTKARESHTATLLKDGTVLITGGHRGRRAAIEIYRSAEIYNPQTGNFTAAADLTVKRHKHDAVLLGDGRVLIVGGSDERDSGGAYTNVEIYNPQTKTFRKIGDMRFARYKLQGTSVLLKNGKVLIAGGSNQAEIFNPATDSFEAAEGKFETSKLFSTATLLRDGQVLIAGGYDQSINISAKAWISKS
jgi:N-acetylneuraminic acid mutarotase